MSNNFAVHIHYQSGRNIGPSVITLKNMIDSDTGVIVFEFQTQINVALKFCWFFGWILIITIISRVIKRDIKANHIMNIVPHTACVGVFNDINLGLIAFDDLNGVVNTQLTVHSIEERFFIPIMFAWHLGNFVISIVAYNKSRTLYLFLFPTSVSAPHRTCHAKTFAWWTC